MTLLMHVRVENAAEGKPNTRSAVSRPSCDPVTLDPIYDVLRDISQQEGGEALLATWHEHCGTPAYLTWHNGDAVDPGVSSEMLAAACRFSQVGQDSINWCPGANGPHGIKVMCFPVQGGVVTVTVLYLQMEELERSLEKGEAWPLRPLLTPFFRLWVLQLRTASRAEGLVGAINKLDVATFHFDASGRLLFGNEAGLALIVAGDGLRRSDTSLGGTTWADTIALQSAIDDVIQADGRAANASQECPVVALTRAGRRPLLAAVAAIDPDRALQGGTAAVVYVIDPDQELRLRLEPICRLYCLSPVETNLACLLADGASLTDAASQISIREQTARSYLKQIFAKTQTSRQAELVGLLLKSAVLMVGHPAGAKPDTGYPSIGGEGKSRIGADEH